MNLPQVMESLRPVDENPSGMSRRLFFKGATVVGAGSAIGLGGIVNPPRIRPGRGRRNPNDEAARRFDERRP